MAEGKRSDRHPGEPHDFRTVCGRCGKDGMLHVAVITDDEVVRIESRPYVAPPMADRLIRAGVSPSAGDARLREAIQTHFDAHHGGIVGKCIDEIVEATHATD